MFDLLEIDNRELLILNHGYIWGFKVQILFKSLDFVIYGPVYSVRFIYVLCSRL